MENDQDGRRFELFCWKGFLPQCTVSDLVTDSVTGAAGLIKYEMPTIH